MVITRHGRTLQRIESGASGRLGGQFECEAEEKAMNGWDYMESVQRRAYELAKDQSPYYNMAPLFELIQQADRLGCDIVKKPVQNRAQGE